MIRNIISKLFITDASMGASFNSEALRLLRASEFSIQLVFTGSPVGTLKLQSSSDTTSLGGEVVNWDDIPDSSQGITEAGSHSWKVEERHKWVRVSYQRESGTGLCQGTIFAVEER